METELYLSEIVWIEIENGLMEIAPSQESKRLGLGLGLEI